MKIYKLSYSVEARDDLYRLYEFLVQTDAVQRAQMVSAQAGLRALLVHTSMKVLGSFMCTMDFRSHRFRG